MGYYDSVKDDIKDDKDSGSSSKKKSSGSSNSSNFDTLKKAAQESSGEKPEEKGDDTPIEVIEDGISRDSPKRQQQAQQQQQQNQQAAQNQQPQQSQGLQDGGRPVQQGSGNSSVDTSSLEDKLDRIIEQNDRMIEILESFGS